MGVVGEPVDVQTNADAARSNGGQDPLKVLDLVGTEWECQWPHLSFVADTAAVTWHRMLLRRKVIAVEHSTTLGYASQKLNDRLTVVVSRRLRENAAHAARRPSAVAD